MNIRIATAHMTACKRQRDILMSKKLLIDAHQHEETRVVLLNDQKIEEFDYENTARKQLKGNVYLALSLIHI